MAFLRVENLTKKFPIKAGFFGRTAGYVHAVNGVSFSIEEGKTLGLVGESGCGKSTLAKLLLKLIPSDSGQIELGGERVDHLSSSKTRKLRRRIQMIFQDPFSSLNPRMSVGSILEEGLKIHGIGNRKTRKEKVAQILQKVGLPASAKNQYPHEFSGGQRQRIGIARALILLPQMIVCDEPVSALDVSVQAQIVNLLTDLKDQLQLTYLFISHDLKIVHHMSDQIAVMYLGKIVEFLKSEDLFQARHPYTLGLLHAVPQIHLEKDRSSALLKTEIPSSIHLPSGCAFHPRCPYAEEVCRREVPMLREIGSSHRAACHLAEKIPTFPV